MKCTVLVLVSFASQNLHPFEQQSCGVVCLRQLKFWWMRQFIHTVHRVTNIQPGLHISLALSLREVDTYTKRLPSMTHIHMRPRASFVTFDEKKFEKLPPLDSISVSNVCMPAFFFNVGLRPVALAEPTVLVSSCCAPS